MGSGMGVGVGVKVGAEWLIIQDAPMHACMHAMAHVPTVPCWHEGDKKGPLSITLSVKFRMSCSIYVSPWYGTVYLNLLAVRIPGSAAPACRHYLQQIRRALQGQHSCTASVPQQLAIALALRPCGLLLLFICWLA